MLNQLIDIGVLSKDKAMGIRMMLIMFTLPKTDEDLLQSKIEVTKEVRVLASAQRICQDFAVAIVASALPLPSHYLAGYRTFLAV